jgi:putative transposase
MIFALIDEAVHAGARLGPAAKIMGLSARTIIRWRKKAGGEDERKGPKAPPNKLSDQERQKVLDTANRPEFRDMSPKQIVPKLADKGVYLASESTFYRVLRAHSMLAHHQSSKPAVSRRPEEHVATGPWQVWSWDITYLKTPVKGMFFYLYMIVDIWSRKIISAEVHAEESMDHSARMIARACLRHGVYPPGLVLHSDNGGPMKGATMLATLHKLGVIPSFSRPRVSDDNPYSESLFRTMKYRPEYPSKPFETIEKAQAWVDGFVQWYNTMHLHSAIRFVTPDERHYSQEEKILARRHLVYEAARHRNPNRWSGKTRNWEPVRVVRLNPEKKCDNQTIMLKAA